MTVSLIKDYNLQVIKNIVVALGDANDIVPVDFYKFDADQVVVVKREMDNKDYIKVFAGVHCSPTISDTVYSNEAFIQGSCPEINTEYLVDIKRREVIAKRGELNEYSDWSYIPTILEPDKTPIRSVLMFNHVKRNFYSANSLDGEIPAVVFSLGFITRFMRLNTTNKLKMTEVGKEFLITLICKWYGLAIPDWKRYSVHQIEFNPRVEENQFPADLLKDLISLGAAICTEKQNDEIIENMRRIEEEETDSHMMIIQPNTSTVKQIPLTLPVTLPGPNGTLLSINNNVESFKSLEERMAEEDESDDNWQREIDMSNPEEYERNIDGTFSRKSTQEIMHNIETQREMEERIPKEGEESDLEIRSAGKLLPLSELVSLGHPIRANDSEYPIKVAMDIPLDELNNCRSIWIISDTKLALFVKGSLTPAMIMYAHDLFSGYSMDFIDYENPKNTTFENDDKPKEDKKEKETRSKKSLLSRKAQ